MARLKLDSSGAVVLQDGHPVWIGDDNKEAVIDIGRLMRQNVDLQAKLKITVDGVRGFLLKTAFEKSHFLRDKSNLPADIALNTFGQNFEVEEDVDGYRLVGKVDGRPLFSRKNPGQHADADEVLETLFERHPDRDRILKKADGNERHAAPSGPKGQADNNAPADRALRSTDKISAGLKQLRGAQA